MLDLTTLPSTASVPALSGLVHLLDDYSLALPSTGQIGLSTAQRVRIEVADFLDARQQQDVALSQVDATWLSDFQNYLQIFYSDALVLRYLQVVRTILGLNSQNLVGFCG